jgi:hypothetical protein
MRSISVLERLKPRIQVDPNTGCWVCSGWSTGNGYAKIRVNGKCRVAHRALYEEFHSVTLSNDLVLDHKCRNRACVNPFHLEPVTHRENTLRGEAVLFKSTRTLQ